MVLSEKGFMSVAEAARQLGVTGGRIRQMLRAEELLGEKLNERAWAVRVDSVEQALRTHNPSKPGRPRTGPK